MRIFGFPFTTKPPILFDLPGFGCEGHSRERDKEVLFVYLQRCGLLVYLYLYEALGGACRNTENGSAALFLCPANIIRQF